MQLSGYLEIKTKTKTFNVSGLFYTDEACTQFCLGSDCLLSGRSVVDVKLTELHNLGLEHRFKKPSEKITLYIIWLRNALVFSNENGYHVFNWGLVYHIRACLLRRC